MFIDAGPMGNHTRFINHSCKNNCKAEESALNELTIVAAKDIGKDEEILLNYGEEYFEHTVCLCGEDNCFDKESLIISVTRISSKKAN